MNVQTRTFEVKQGVRESVPMLVGLMGCSGSGKTFSALRLASGIQKVVGGDIHVIDTESRRALHYADNFSFKHVQFDAPFGSLDYLAAMQQCVKAGAKVIVIDSLTHEHSGPGGYLLTQEEELSRMAGEDYAKRERVKFAAWIKPAKLRQQMISGILQLNCNFIFAFRAKEKTKPIRNEKGRVEPVEMGFMPIAGEELLFEMTVNCLLLPKAGGVPTWRSDHVGERLMMKCPSQFESVFADAKPLDEEIGQHLAQWAKGDLKPTPTAKVPDEPGATFDEDPLRSEQLISWDNKLAEAAKGGTAVLRSAWDIVPTPLKNSLKAALDRRHKPAALVADQAAGQFDDLQPAAAE